jgi:hypothetical protein
MGSVLGGDGLKTYRYTRNFFVGGMAPTPSFSIEKIESQLAMVSFPAVVN